MLSLFQLLSGNFLDPAALRRLSENQKQIENNACYSLCMLLCLNKGKLGLHTSMGISRMKTLLTIRPKYFACQFFGQVILQLPSLLFSCFPVIPPPCLTLFLFPPVLVNSYIYMSSPPQSTKCIKHSLEINGPWAMQRSQYHHGRCSAETVGRLSTVVWMFDGNDARVCAHISKLLRDQSKFYNKRTTDRNKKAPFHFPWCCSQKEQSDQRWDHPSFTKVWSPTVRFGGLDFFLIFYNFNIPKNPNCSRYDAFFCSSSCSLHINEMHNPDWMSLEIPVNVSKQQRKLYKAIQPWAFMYYTEL